MNPLAGGVDAGYRAPMPTPPPASGTAQPPDPPWPTVRRVVTGIDAAGRSVVQSDGPAPVGRDSSDYGSRLFELWATDGTPPSLDGPDLTGLPFELEPRPGGVKWRLAVWAPRDQAGPLHSTDTVDLIYIVSGEQILEVGEGDRRQEVHLRAGDCAVLRAIVHTWRNPGTVPCVAVCSMLAASAP